MIKRRWTRFRRAMGSLFKRDGFWWIVLVLVTLAVCGYLVFTYWCYLRDGPESLSSTVRNVSLIIGGIIAIELALWRGIVGERQTAVAQRQAETAQRDLLNQQFQKGAEMLGSNVLSVRLGGIYALRYLALEHSVHFHVQVMEQLCAFVRGSTGADGQSTAIVEEELITHEELLARYPDQEDLPNQLSVERYRACADVQEAMNAIAFCHAGNLEIETTQGYWLDLQDADLRGADLSDMNLSRAPLVNDFSKSFDQLIAVSRYTNMRGVKLDDAFLLGIALSGVDLSHATGLTQIDVDYARVDPDNKPRLTDVIDAQTGEPIVWKGSSTNGE